MILTIDGPAGAGKSTVSKKVASRLGLNFLDTGALYRALAWALCKMKVAPAECAKMNEALQKIDVELADGKVLVNGDDVSSKIRTSEVDKIVSPYSAIASVRARLLGLQRRQTEKGGLVAEGRDLGSVVFPNADVKIFLTASAEERATRRYKERVTKGESPDYGEILASVIERDRIDSTREIAPLKKPEGAHVVDSSSMPEPQVVEEIVRIAKLHKVKKSVASWLDGAQYDVGTAEAMLNTGRYLYVGFMCHLAVEKSLKAMIANSGIFPPKTHDLLRLARVSFVDDEMTEGQKDFLEFLMPLNIEARYSEHREELSRKLNNKICEEILKKTEDFIAWIKARLCD